MWARVLEASQDRPAIAGMLRYMTLVALSNTHAELTPLPGHRELLAAFAPRHGTQVAQMLEPIIGRKVQVKLREGMTQKQQAEQPQQQQSPSNGSTLDRRQAMDLPLVKQLGELFEVSLVEIRPLTQEKAPAADAGDESEYDDQADDMSTPDLDEADDE